MQNLMRCVARGSRAVRTFGVRPVRYGPARLAAENPLLKGMRNLMRRVPQVLMYSSRPKAHTVHVAPVRLAHQNLRFSGAEPGLP